MTIKFINTPIKIDLQYMRSSQLNSSKIMLYDTTLRDGNQSVGINFSKNDKIKIAKKIGLSFFIEVFPFYLLCYIYLIVKTFNDKEIYKAKLICKYC